MEKDFDPEKVGSIFWLLESDGNWVTGDHSGMQGDTIQTVEIGDYEKLLAMYLEIKGKYERLNKER